MSTRNGRGKASASSSDLMGRARDGRERPSDFIAGFRLDCRDDPSRRTESSGSATAHIDVASLKFRLFLLCSLPDGEMASMARKSECAGGDRASAALSRKGRGEKRDIVNFMNFTPSGSA